MRHSAYHGILISQRLSPAELLNGTRTGIPVEEAPAVIVLQDPNHMLMLMIAEVERIIAVPAMLTRQTLITDYFSKSTGKRQLLITDFFSKRIRTACIDVECVGALLLCRSGAVVGSQAFVGQKVVVFVAKPLSCRMSLKYCVRLYSLCMWWRLRRCYSIDQPLVALPPLLVAEYTPGCSCTRCGAALPLGSLCLHRTVQRCVASCSQLFLHERFPSFL